MVNIIADVTKSGHGGRGPCHLEAQITCLSDIWPHVVKNPFVMLGQSVRQPKDPVSVYGMKRCLMLRSNS